METSLAPWLKAMRRSQERLQALVDPLSVTQLDQLSYASEWSIAQVLSHLGAQVEIFSLYLNAALTGDRAPGREAFEPIWATWNARGPEAQASDSLRGDKELVDRFEAFTSDQREHLHLEMFGMELDATGLARMRLSEHAIHTWDVAVALDPAATVAPDAVELLVDTLDQLAARTGKPDGTGRTVGITTAAPERHFSLEIGEKVALSPSAQNDDQLQLRLPAEALLRLVYGRLDPNHTPPYEAEGIDLDQLRPIFPGF
jgi:uncharacterized protein (TIGR03083 family)